MSRRVFKSGRGKEVDARPLGAALRPVGRVALWAVLAVLLVRGAAAILQSPEARPASVGHRGPAGPGQAADGLAVGFARAFLEPSSTNDVAAYLAGGAHLAPGRPSGAAGQVAQAEVVRSEPLGGGRWVLTVSCDLRDARTLDLAVPIVRKGAGEVAVMGAPSIVAVPAPAGADPERPRPLAGPGAGAIGELVAKFLPAYVGAGRTSDLSYLLAPGAKVVPLGGGLELVTVGHARQLDDSEGPERDLLVAARLGDPAGGATYALSYRLRVIERAGRWYVAAVEGSVS